MGSELNPVAAFGDAPTTAHIPSTSPSDQQAGPTKATRLLHSKMTWIVGLVVVIGLAVGMWLWNRTPSFSDPQELSAAAAKVIPGLATATCVSRSSPGSVTQADGTRVAVFPAIESLNCSQGGSPFPSKRGLWFYVIDENNSLQVEWLTQGHSSIRLKIPQGCSDSTSLGFGAIFGSNWQIGVTIDGDGATPTAQRAAVRQLADALGGDAYCW